MSMTGYGRVEMPLEEKNLIVEIRSLNSKLADVRIKTTLHLGYRELELRKLILENALRGKIDVSIEIKANGLTELALPNTELIKTYYDSLKALADEMGVEDENLYSTILKMPNVFAAENGELDEDMWEVIQDATQKALDNLEAFRKTEGTEIMNDLAQRVEMIQELLVQVEPLEKDRSVSLKERLRQKMQELETESIDQNRYEQEILYYLDKLDIHEEKMRLEQHCKYFLSELEAVQAFNGKKLNFISQEIGREINTLGAKAQWSPIQHLVVQMKNELEKIKEQLANVL